MRGKKSEKTKWEKKDEKTHEGDKTKKRGKRRNMPDCKRASETMEAMKTLRPRVMGHKKGKEGDGNWRKSLEQGENSPKKGLKTGRLVHRQEGKR